MFMYMYMYTSVVCMNLCLMTCIILYAVMSSSYVAPPPETQREGPVNPTPKDYHHLESNRSLLHPPPGPPCSENMVHVHVYSLTPLIDNYMYMYVYIHLHDCTYTCMGVCVCMHNIHVHVPSLRSSDPFSHTTVIK